MTSSSPLQNWNHNALYCGGFASQFNSVNRGRCGLCGDDFSGSQDHMAGGKFATGTVARSYTAGQMIDIEIDLVANHLGFFTFSLCPHNSVLTRPSRECFLSHPLAVQGPGRGELSTYLATKGTGVKEMRVQLPANLTCSQCILQVRKQSLSIHKQG